MVTTSQSAYAENISTTSTNIEIIAEAEALFRSESLPLSTFTKDRFARDDFDPKGETSYTFNSIFLGLRKGSWEVGTLARYDAFIDYSRDMAELYVASELDETVPDGRYDISANVNHVASYGGRLGYTANFFDKLDTTLRVSGLVAKNPLIGTVEGELIFDDGTSGNIALDYSYIDDLIFDREVNDPTGYGVAVDLLLAWQATSDLRIEGGVYDAFSRIWWSDLPRTTADATSAISRIGEDGILDVRPTIQGINFEDNVEQSFRERYNLSVIYDLSSDWKLSQNTLRFGKNWLSTTRLDHDITPNLTLGAAIEWDSGALGAHLKWQAFEIGLVTDNTNFNDAKYLNAYARLSHRF